MKNSKFVIGEKVKCLIFKNLDSTILKNFKFQIPVIKKRTLYGSRFLLTGFLNHVPEISIFLLGSGAKKVSLFSMNFFMSTNAYLENYRKLPTLHCLFLIGDSLVAGHIYLKRLYELGLVECDENVLEVIKLSTEDYIQNIENIYRDTIKTTTKKDKK